MTPKWQLRKQEVIVLGSVRRTRRGARQNREGEVALANTTLKKAAQ